MHGNLNTSIQPATLAPAVAGAAAIRAKIEQTQQQIRFTQNGIQACEGHLLDFDSAEGLLRALDAASHNLAELRGCCFMCGSVIGEDQSCDCFPAKGVR